MATKAWVSQQKPVEEVFVQNDAVSVCMLINRRASTVRVIDFRAGPSSAKRLFVQSFAKREALHKVYTLVERDEVATWVKLGFAKEGSIPAFYKRSDAFLLGCTVWSSAASPDALVMLAEGFKPCTAFLEGSLPPISAGAGRWLAHNPAQFLRHLNERKLYERHGPNITGWMQLST